MSSRTYVERDMTEPPTVRRGLPGRGEHTTHHGGWYRFRLVTPIRHDAGTGIPLAPNERGWKRLPGAGDQMLRVMGKFVGAHGGTARGTPADP